MNKQIQNMVLASIFIALIIMMTIVPFTGYITVGLIEITTLHIVVILGAILLGPLYGSLLGFTWGVTCLIRAFTNPAWVMFTNPLISVLPRILVGLIAGLLFKAICKSSESSNTRKAIAVQVSAIVATLSNTVMVLSAIYLFGGMIDAYSKFFEMFKTIFLTIIGTNGLIELAGSIVIIPILYAVVSKIRKKQISQ